MKKQLHWTPDTVKKVAQLSQDLSAHKEKIKSLSTKNQSAQVVAATDTEERDKIAVDLAGFEATMNENDEAHKDILVKMEESLTQLRNAYDQMIKERDLHKSGEADPKVKMEAMENSHGAEVEDLKLEIADLNKRMDELRSTKVCHLIEGRRLPKLWPWSTTL
ncbi:hypothetical protein Hanom_Chr10g00942631 [Helianthus anomalus]